MEVDVYFDSKTQELYSMKNFDVKPYSGDQDSLTTIQDYMVGGEVIKQGVCGWYMHPDGDSCPTVGQPIQKWLKLYV